MHFGAGHDGGHFLLLDHLPVDEIFDIRVICITDHHFRRPAGGTARFDCTCGPIPNFQKAHKAGRLATTRKIFASTAQGREVGSGAGAVLKQTRFTHPKIHDPAIIHQIIGDGLNEASMRLRMLIAAVRFGQLASLVIDVMMPLRRAINPIGPMQPSVKPLRRVRSGSLGCQHIAHLVKISAGVLFRGKITTLPAPIGPCASQTIKDLLGGGFPAKCCILCRHAATQKARHA